MKQDKARKLEHRFFSRSVFEQAIESRKAQPDCEATAGPAVTVRDAGEGLSQIVGYSAVFGVDTSIDTYFGSFRERIKKGAFRRALREGQDVRALRNHDPDNLLGRTASKTLRMREDDIGLAIEIDVPNTSVGKDTLELISRGDISGMSFAFVVTAERWITGGEGEADLRIIEDVELYDVGPVTYPAYPQTTADARSLAEIHQRGMAEMGKPVQEIPDPDETPVAEVPAEVEAAPEVETPVEEAPPETPTETPVEEPADRSAVESARLRLIRVNQAKVANEIR